ncbi:hypothetical protein EJD97_004364 [Solanum chilense]|uniref:Uncharacterized protein n=1 Tax=Solanum chilense TaxID=4083 RepID=A0A6N2BUQ7_SOLCI|nr:hypothetical protein EJD97_004364 [Solanum chilense]
MPPLSKNLTDTVDLVQGAEPSTAEPADTTPEDSTLATSQAPSSSRSIPPSVALVPLARVQSLKAQMATVLHHIQPWMQNSIDEAKDRK